MGSTTTTTVIKQLYAHKYIITAATLSTLGLGVAWTHQLDYKKQNEMEEASAIGSDDDSRHRHLLLRSNEQVHLEQSAFRELREMMTKVTVEASKKIPNREAVVAQVASEIKELGSDPKDFSFVEQSGVLSFLLNIAAGKDCSGCTDTYLDVMGQIASSHRMLIAIAENATRYGKESLLNIAFTHEKDQRLGNALQLLARQDIPVKVFGPANLVSLIALVSSTGLPPCYYEFAWWALAQACSDNPRSISTRYRIKKAIFGDDRVAKTRRTLMSNHALWSALHRINDTAIQQQAMKLLVELAKSHPSSSSWSPSQLDLLLKAAVNRDDSISTSALQALEQLVSLPENRESLVSLGIVKVLYHHCRDIENSDTKSTNKLVSAFSILNTLSSTEILTPKNALSKIVSQEYDNVMHDGTMYSNVYHEYLPGWLEIFTHGLKIRDTQPVVVNGLKNFVSTIRSSNNNNNQILRPSVILYEWAGTLVEGMASQVPYLQNSPRILLLKHRERPNAVGGVNSTAAEASSMLLLLRTMAYLAEREEVRQVFYQMGGMEFLNNAVGENSLFINQQVARTIANLLVSSSKDIKQYLAQPEWKDRILSWMSSSDMKLASYALRAYTNLNSENSCYYDGINPILLSGSDHNNDEDKYYRQSTKSSEVDIVLIHGLLGGAFETWKGGVSALDQNNTTVKKGEMWVSEWLASAIAAEGNLKARVTSVGYEANLISSAAAWPPLSLEERAQKLLPQLRAAGIGRNHTPIVFLTHSMGGILLKELLYLAAQKDPSFFHNARVAIFYGVPHRGSPLANVTTYTVTKTLVPPHPATKDLHGSVHLTTLNDHFKDCREISSLSLGETLNSVLPIVGTERMIVPPESSSPGFGSHVVIPQASHSDICKPVNESDLRYSLVKDFIIEELYKNK